VAVGVAAGGTVASNTPKGDAKTKLYSHSPTTIGASIARTKIARVAQLLIRTLTAQVVPARPFAAYIIGRYCEEVVIANEQRCYDLDRLLPTPRAPGRRARVVAKPVDSAINPLAHTLGHLRVARQNAGNGPEASVNQAGDVSDRCLPTRRSSSQDGDSPRGPQLAKGRNRAGCGNGQSAGRDPRATVEVPTGPLARPLLETSGNGSIGIKPR
jgi:hypothetical protein